MKKVFCVISSADIGGAERYFVSLLDGLRRSGVRTAVACPGTGPMTAEYAARADELFPLDLSRVYDTRAVVRLDGFIRESRPDLVHTHLWNADALGALAARRRDSPPLVSTVYGAYHLPFGTRGLRRVRRTGLSMTYRAVYRGFRRIIAVSHYVRDDLLGRVGLKVDPASVGVVYPGIETPLSAPVAPRRDHFRVVCVANFHSVKGHEWLVRALPSLFRRVPAARCVLVGDGPERARVRSLAEDLGVAGRVDFLGGTPDALSAIRDSQALVLPSLSEGLPLSVLEAWSLGVPVVATRVGGLPELVSEGVDGLLVAARAPEALAEALARLLSDPRLAGALAEGGRRTVADRFSTARMTDGVLAEYAVALESSR